MRVSVFIATSLDGFIARPDGAIDWLETAAGPAEGDFGYAAFVETTDVLVLGRKTFEKVLAFEAWPYAGRAVYVLTRRPLELPTELRASVRTSSLSPPELVGSLEAEGLTHAYLDGGEVIQSFLRAGLVDRMTITRIPVLLGEGRPLFGALDQDVSVHHHRTEVFANGFVQSTYDVLR